MKNTIFQCVTALICVVALCVTCMLGVGKLADAKLEGAKLAAEAAGQSAGDVAEDETADVPAGDETADVPAGDETADVPAGDETATDASAADKPAADNAAKGPQTTAEIVAYYNNAINKVISAKAGFNKNRTTTMKTLDGGAILKIQLVADMVNDFLGVGSKDWNNTKGKQENLSKASLTASDVKTASCTENNGVYTITIALKDGKSTASNGATPTDTCPLSRSGLYTGKGDKIAFDYKSSENFHTAINGVEDCTVESAAEQVSGAKIVATVDAKTGNLQTLTVTWDWAVQLSNIKYTFIPLKLATGEATTVVKLTNVKW